MAKFGTKWFGGGRFGTSENNFINFFKSYHRIPLGLLVRGTLKNEVIYRVRRGTGYYGSVKGKIYQDKYKYFVPSSINNPESETYREKWARAVKIWQITLTADQKAEYNTRATHGLRMSGYNLFMREYMLSEEGMFVDRGHSDVKDFLVGDFTTDNTWYDLDWSSVVPSNAQAVLIDVGVIAATGDIRINFTKYNRHDAANAATAYQMLSWVYQRTQLIIQADSNQKFSYRASDVTWWSIDFLILGWWI